MELDREGKSYTADTLRGHPGAVPGRPAVAAYGDRHVPHPPPVARPGGHHRSWRGSAPLAEQSRTERSCSPPRGSSSAQKLSGPDRHHHPAGTGGCVLYPAAGAAGPGGGTGVSAPPGVRLYPDAPAVRHPRGPEAAGASGAAGLFLLHDPGQAGPPCYGRGGGGGAPGRALGRGRGAWPAGRLSSTTAPSIWNWTTSSRLCRQYGVELDELEQQAVKLLHAKTGACIARDIFGEPDEVYQAIFWHTTAKADMTLLEKIIYIADYIEPNRDFEGVERAAPAGVSRTWTGPCCWGWRPPSRRCRTAGSPSTPIPSGPGTG